MLGRDRLWAVLAMIRPARQADLDAVRALAEAHEHGLDYKGVNRSRWSPPLLVAEVDGAIVGYVHALIGEPYAIITELVVAQDARGKGVGTALLEGMELTLRLMGVRVWASFTASTNMIAQKALDTRATCTGHGVGYVKILEESS